MSSSHTVRTVICTLGCLLLAGGLHAQLSDSERDERVPGHRPSVVRMSELAHTPTGETFGAPRFHIQGQHTQRVRRGVELVPGRSDRPADADTETVEPEVRDYAPEMFESAVHLNKKAIDFTGWIPPDAVVAASSSYMLTAVNNGLTVYDSAGTEVQAFTNFTNFFAAKQPAGWQGFYFDPRVAYVVAESQFLILVLGRDDVAQTSYLFLGVSQTSDPTGAWWLYRYRADKNNQVDMWLDFPGLAGDGWGVYMTGNYFSNSGNNFQYAGLWSINPAVYTGGSGNGWKKTNITWPSTGSAVFNIQPAVPYSIAGGEETFFAATYTSSGSEVLLMTMTGDRTNNPALAKDEIGILAYDAIGENVDQPGTSQDLDGGDCRVGNAVYAQRRVYVALSTDTDNDGDRAGVIAAKLHVDNGTREWQKLTTGSDGKYYIYPAVTIGSGASTSPKIAWFGTWAGSSKNPSTLYRLFDSGSSHTPIEFINTKTGLDDYELLDINNSNRWGDYSGAALQAGSDDMCGLSQYATSNTTWATRLVCID